MGSKSTNKVKRPRPEFIDSLINTFQENGRILTIFTVILIAISGISLVDNIDRWWVTPLALVLFFTTIFLFMNARIFIKIAVVCIMTLFMSVFAFQAGSYLSPYDNGGILWMSATLFSFFGLLSLSYIIHSGKSRWGTLGVSLIVGFILTYALNISMLNTVASAIIGVFASTIYFVIFYSFTKKTRYNKNDMPDNLLMPDMKKNIEEGLDFCKWNHTLLNYDEDEKTGGVLTWKDSAYYLYPIYMDSSFTMTGNRMSQMHLGYHDKNINAWLSDIVFKNIPSWIARGANITLVLLDVNDANGKETKIIGVSLPDTKRKIPVAIIPAKRLSRSHKYMDQIITNVDSEFSIFTKPLKNKQLFALSRIGKTNEPKKTTTVDPIKKKRQA